MLHLTGLGSALVSSGCWNKCTRDWVTLSRTHLFLRVLGAGKSKVKVPDDQA